MVGREGFEPPKAKLADLQSASFGHSDICPYNKKMEPLVGFEPTTIRLQGECSTSWAKVAFLNAWVFYEKT